MQHPYHRRVPNELIVRSFYKSSKIYLKSLCDTRKDALDQYVSLCTTYIPKGDLILDIGCGTGYSTRLFAEKGYDVIGSDLSLKFITNNEMNSNLGFVVADALSLPFKNEYFDAVCSCALIEHLIDVQLALKEMSRVLRPKGKLIILAPNLLNIFTSVKFLLHPSVRLNLYQGTCRLKTLKILFKNFLHLIKKKLCNKIELIYRDANYEFDNYEDFVSDMDACFVSNPIDIAKLLKKMGFSSHNIRYYGKNIAKKVLYQIFPLSNSVRIVATKNE